MSETAVANPSALAAPPRANPLRIAVLPTWDPEKDSPWEKEWQFLMNKGWVPEGDPKDPHSLWYDPERPTSDSQEIKDHDVLEQDDPKNLGRTIKRIKRTFVTGAQIPVPRGAAVALQLRRQAQQEDQAIAIREAEEARTKRDPEPEPAPRPAPQARRK